MRHNRTSAVLADDFQYPQHGRFRRYQRTTCPLRCDRRVTAFAFRRTGRTFTLRTFSTFELVCMAVVFFSVSFFIRLRVTQ